MREFGTAVTIVRVESVENGFKRRRKTMGIALPEPRIPRLITFHGNDKTSKALEAGGDEEGEEENVDGDSDSDGDDAICHCCRCCFCGIT